MCLWSATALCVKSSNTPRLSLPVVSLFRGGRLSDTKHNPFSEYMENAVNKVAAAKGEKELKLTVSVGGGGRHHGRLTGNRWRAGVNGADNRHEEMPSKE